VVETSATAPPVTGMVIILSLFPMPETVVKALENSLFLSHLSLNSVKCDKLRSELMEQIMGGRYTARGMWGERRSHRRTGGGRAGSWQGQAGYGGGHPDEMTSGGLRVMYVSPLSRVVSGLSFLWFFSMEDDLYIRSLFRRSVEG
jgi:hypothetical protein